MPQFRSVKDPKEVKVIKHCDAKAHPNILNTLLAMPAVYIFSDEQSHQCYWRGGGNGYTNRICSAGVYTGEAAWKATSHCGPEKYIEYEEVCGLPQTGEITNVQPINDQGTEQESSQQG